MNYEKCIYNRFCRTKNSDAICTLFIPEPTETELLDMLKTASVYKWVAVIDDRTCEGCLEANGKLLTKAELVNFEPHLAILKDTYNKYRCVLNPVEWEDDGKRMPNPIS